MVGRHTGAKTDAVFGHGGKINRRDEESAAAQFMTQLVHSCPIADDKRHDVSARCAGVDPDRVQMLAEIIRVRPKPIAQAWFASGDF
jgi:hypothetical protein